MTNFEREVKILEIDKHDVISKLEMLGAKCISNNMQKIYVYDLPSIYSRYLDCLNLLANCDKEYEKEVVRSKLNGVIFELEDLLNDDDRKSILDITSGKQMSEILKDNEINDWKELLSSQELLKIVQKYNINPNKWVRLRQTGEKVALTVKHIVNSNDEHFQKVLETEFEVPSLEECNNMLYQLGFTYRNYQEKERVSYILDGVEIDIDSWPLIPTYMEIENDDINKIKNIIHMLELDEKEMVSCNTEKIYERYGLDVYSYRELKF